MSRSYSSRISRPDDREGRDESPAANSVGGFYDSYYEDNNSGGGSYNANRRGSDNHSQQGDSSYSLRSRNRGSQDQGSHRDSYSDPVRRVGTDASNNAARRGSNSYRRDGYQQPSYNDSYNNNAPYEDNRHSYSREGSRSSRGSRGGSWQYSPSQPADRYSPSGPADQYAQYQSPKYAQYQSYSPHQPSYTSRVGGHWRGGSRSPMGNSTPGSPASPGRRGGKGKKGDFVVPLPDAKYIDLSRQPPETPAPDAPGVRKLLVLDLNGALIYRTQTNATRGMHPRPFLSVFLEYLFKDEPDGTHSPWEVLVWSSAQPHNVRAMVETGFGRWCNGVWEEEQNKPEGEGRLLDVWARDKMSLGTDYNFDVQTTKDLRKVTNELGRYDEATTVLLDDSSLKGVYQPWSQIIISEFDKPEYHDSKVAIERMAARARSASRPNTPASTSSKKNKGKGKKASKESLTDAASANAGPIDPSVEPGLDNILLSVVGILEAMRGVSNVPAWVRSGGIQNPTGSAADTSVEVTLDMLPSHSSFTTWFDNPETHAYWAQKGKEALQRKGIPLRHSPDGFSYDETPQASPQTGERQSNQRIRASADERLADLKLDDSQLTANSQSASRADGHQGTPAFVYHHLMTVADGSLVDDDQRRVILDAIKILQDIGGAVAHNDDDTSLAPHMVDPTPPQGTYPQYRPRPADLRWLAGLTADQLKTYQKAASAIEAKLRADTSQDEERKRAWLLNLKNYQTRLDLVLYPPGTPAFTQLLTEYEALPDRPAGGAVAAHPSKRGRSDQQSEGTAPQGLKGKFKKTRHL